MRPAGGVGRSGDGVRLVDLPERSRGRDGTGGTGDVALRSPASEADEEGREEEVALLPVPVRPERLETADADSDVAREAEEAVRGRVFVVGTASLSSAEVGWGGIEAVVDVIDDFRVRDDTLGTVRALRGGSSVVVVAADERSFPAEMDVFIVVGDGPMTGGLFSAFFTEVVWVLPRKVPRVSSSTEN
jgi:hypothetical protein